MGEAARALEPACIMPRILVIEGILLTAWKNEVALWTLGELIRINDRVVSQLSQLQKNPCAKNLHAHFIISASQKVLELIDGLVFHHPT